MAQKNYSGQWKKVDSLQNLGQIKPALDEVMEIYKNSKTDNIPDQHIKALLYKIMLESEYQENNYEKAIAFVNDELITSQSPVRQILYSILARVYWDYYKNYRWQINDRTPVTGDQSMDITTWDASRFVEICTQYYSLSVSESDVLQKIPLTQYEGILEEKKDTRKFRPTLYDFLAFRAIEFFTDESSFAVQPINSFKESNEKYFAPAVEFIRTPFVSEDQDSFISHALKLYREVLQFHAGDKTDVSAMIDADLARLAFVHRTCIRSDNDQLYIKALRNLGEKYKDQPVSADIWYQLAVRLENEGSKYKPGVSEAHQWEIKEALEIAEKTAIQFPGTDGGKNCLSLTSNIKQPSLQITGDYAVIPQQPSLALVEYKNVSTLFFRIVKIDPKSVRDEDYGNQKNVLKEYLAQSALHNWSLEMPLDGDYQKHSAEIKIAALQPGFYVLLSSVTPDFKVDSLITFSRFWSTGISMISRRINNGSTDLLVFDRKEGLPMPNVTVRVFYSVYDYSKRKVVENPGETFLTDNNGYVHLNADDKERNNRFYLVLSTARDKFITESFYMGYRNENESQAEISTHFFTDRGIYRPGQTIFYKGIVTEKKGDRSEIKTGYKTTVKFRDVNQQEISKQEVVTNEYGSFSGSFVTPQGSLTGRMTIDNDHGNVSVLVEEYKRPKFEIVFNPVEGSFKLGEEVTVTGKATAYAGSPISDGAVTFRVTRNAKFPWFWLGWDKIPSSSPEMEITSGKTTTDSKGEFTIQFNAIPDLSIEEKRSPVFTYSVYADISDINGETHSAETAVSVGYQALLITTSIPDDVNAANGVIFELETSNLNGQSEKATGSITIHKIVKPETLLFSRKWNRPDKFTMTRDEFRKSFPDEVYDREDDITKWAKGEPVYSKSFRTPADSLISALPDPRPGLYLLEIKTKDSFGKEVVYIKYFNVFLPYAGKATTASPVFVTLLKEKAEPGETVPLLLASPLRNVHAILEITSKNGKTKRSFYKIDNQQLRIDIPVNEEHRGNIGIHVAFVKNNRVFQENKTIKVPYTNKELDIAIGSFRDKLEPGQEEEWQITIRDKQGQKAVAEMVATMYDASLDAFTGQNWYFSLNKYLTGIPSWNSDTGFREQNGITYWYPRNYGIIADKEYERMIELEFYGNRRMLKSAISIRGRGNAPEMAMMEDSQAEVFTVAEEMPQPLFTTQTGYMRPSASQSLPPAKPRSDFNETAFFFPQLATNANGETIIRFKMPESLTRWHMMGLAHTKDLKTGMVEKSLVTQKDLMVFPNPPRFFREGDKMQFSAKISNISETPLNGKAELHFFDAFTMKPIDDQMKNYVSICDFNASQGGSAVVNWNIFVPEGLQAVVYRITATAGAFSDGEEAPLPVLTNRMMVTESLPLPVRGNSEKTFIFNKLINSEQASSTLRNYKLTLEYTSNPAWYAVQALPYLMEYPHECSEQVFSRYYANTLASHIANSDPKIKQVFDAWKNISPDALRSNLEKNEELKAVLLQESPWVREAGSESERKQRVAFLFDLNRMASEQKSALKKLMDMQTSNGGWPWFPGMSESEYITQHIVAGLGHLYFLKAISREKNSEMFELLNKAITFLDREKLESFKDLKKNAPDYLKTNHLGYDDIHFFYARTCFLAEFPFDGAMNEMVNYYKAQASQYWNKSNNYLKAMTALFLNRFGDKKTASLIIRSLTETALHNDETGMYWRNERRGWYWYEAPVETQALIIEAYDEVLGDTRSVDELKVWLLKQKQTNDWKTTRATTEAVFALLLRGTSLLSSDQQVSIHAGYVQVNPYLADGIKPEPGTGYFKTSWDAGEITPEMGNVKVENPNKGIAWGAMYWQYFEQLDKITPAQTPLFLSKNLFKEVNSPTGPVLEPITGTKPLHVGDKVVVRVILTADRDMEYIHLKDMRASAFEPVNVLSGYRWHGGLGYYESTRDAATNFFIDFLPKGTYVFEYKLNATQKGDFSNGITSVQCMYAPEFAAHSEGIRVKVE